MKFELFRKDVLYLRIQTAELTAMATVDQNSVRWENPPALNDELDIVSFTKDKVLFGLIKYWFRMHFLTSVRMKVQTDHVVDTVKLQLYGKKIDRQSFGFGIMNNEESIRALESDALSSDRIPMSNKPIGIAEGGNATIPKFKIVHKYYADFDQKEIGKTEFPFFDTAEISYDIKGKK